MKISVTSYSFSQLLRKRLHSQFSMIPLAKSLGFDAIEFTDLTPPEGIERTDYAKMLREECERCGLGVSSYTVAGQMLVPGEAERLKGQVDIAKILGAPNMRHDLIYRLPEGKDFWACVDDIALTAREITEYAKTQGIRTCSENHGFIAQDADRVKAVIDKVANPNYGWLLDIGNFLCTDGDPLSSVEVALPYVFHVHTKDFIRLSSAEGAITTTGGNFIQGCVLGHGVVPVKECVKKVLASGYKGYFTVEFEGPSDCIKAMEESITLLHSLD